MKYTAEEIEAMCVCLNNLEQRGESFRVTPSEFRHLRDMLHSLLTERIKADEEAPLDRRVGWMLESTSGKGWWTGREIWDFTHDPNEAAVFTQHVARWRESNFRGDAKATEHIWISNTHPPAQVQVCDYCQKAPAQPAEHVPEVRLWDTQWMNIVNHDNCYRDWSKEDAINHAVKMTEQAIARNIADGKLPPTRAAAQKADQ